MRAKTIIMISILVLLPEFAAAEQPVPTPFFQEMRKTKTQTAPKSAPMGVRTGNDFHPGSSHSGQQQGQKQLRGIRLKYTH